MKVVITECDLSDFSPEIEVFKRAGVDYSIHQARDANEAVEVAQGADAIIVQFLRVDGALLDRLPTVKVVGRYGAGIDNIDVAAARARDVKVVYAPDFCFHDIADNTMALLLSLTRNVTKVDRLMRRDPRGFVAEYATRSRHYADQLRPTHMTLGIVGMGLAGQAVAKRAAAFGYRMIGYDPYSSPNRMALHGVAWRDGLGDVLRESDVVTLHTPLNRATRHMIGEAELRSMKPTAYLVNTSRGGVIDEPQLVRALQEGWIKGAALDVVEEEPIRPDHPFLTMDNVIVSPHHAFFSRQSYLDLKTWIAQFTVNALRGEGRFDEAK